MTDAFVGGLVVCQLLDVRAPQEVIEVFDNASSLQRSVASVSSCNICLPPLNGLRSKSLQSRPVEYKTRENKSDTRSHECQSAS
eukprot:4871526-Amphidinium_carterae.1